MHAIQDAAGPPASPGLADQGTFVLTVGGRPYGSETFRIKPEDGKIQAEGETQLREGEGRHASLIVTSSKLVLDQALEPKMYSWSAQSPKKYNLSVDFTAPLAKSVLHQPDDKDDIREFKLTKDVVILDNNIIHHYQLLVDRYNRTSGGKQTFNAYIPQAAVPGVLSVQDAGMEKLKISGAEQSLRHLVVVTDNAEIDLWVDAQGRLQRLYWSAPKLEALRQH